jgi:hypothetical protein
MLRTMVMVAVSLIAARLRIQEIVIPLSKRFSQGRTIISGQFSAIN